MNKLFIIVNEDRFLLSHRREIVIGALAKGYNVTIVAKDTGRKNEILALGANYIDLPVNPTGKNLLQELKTFQFLLNLFRKEKPDIVHNVGLKQILWGGLAAKLASVPLMVSAISGLGVMFSNEKLSLYARGILAVLRYSHHRNGVAAIFQNGEDKALFLNHHIILEEQIYFTKGSGVNLEKFAYTPDTESDKVNIIFTARMVKEKGMETLIEAAELLRKDYEDKAEFWLCGGLSNNPKAIKEHELRALCDGKYIQWLGHRTDVRELLMKSHIVAFPSYYREGVPKSLIEASAIGRPIVTTNSVGCKDVVEDGVNGYLIPVKDAEVLSDRLKRLIDDKDLRIIMGKKSREFAERDFDVENVVDTHLKIYAKVNSFNEIRQSFSRCLNEESESLSQATYAS